MWNAEQVKIWALLVRTEPLAYGYNNLTLTTKKGSLCFEPFWKFNECYARTFLKMYFSYLKKKVNRLRK